ncbi:MAG: phosphotransferase [Niameybacter sp.]
MYEVLRDIPDFSKWTKIEQINKGWSQDRKYYVENNENRKFLVRIAEATQYEAKEKEYQFLQKVNRIDAPMSRAIEFGKCQHNQFVYMVLTWVEGQSLNECLANLSEDKQYALGVDAGKLLKKIHQIKVAQEDRHLQDRKERKLGGIAKYKLSPNRIPNDEPIIAFVEENIHLLNPYPSVYLHGDFHPGNMILTPDNKLGIIDFNRWKYGDQYEEFYKIQSFARELSISFSKGQIDGYFEGKPTELFWKVLSVYVAHAALHSIVWAEKFGQEEVEGMKKRCFEALEDYDYFERTVPKWYETATTL